MELPKALVEKFSRLERAYGASTCGMEGSVERLLFPNDGMEDVFSRADVQLIVPPVILQYDNGTNIAAGVFGPNDP